LLDVDRFRPENVSVRLRTALILVALAAMAAGLSLRAERPEPRTATAAAGALAGRPAPDQVLPAIVNAAVTTSATAQTLPGADWRRHARSETGERVVVLSPPTVPEGTARPLTFPLLI